MSILTAFTFFALASIPAPISLMNNIEGRIDTLLHQMSIEEKLGQMSQVALPDQVTPEFKDAVRKGKYGSVYGWGSPKVRAELQKLSIEESRLKIPLIIGQDVIHGYTTGFPIPLAQAATWDPALIKEGARATAKEATQDGIHWTFSPMIDIARDPRWGRIAEGYGEDPILTSKMGVATIEGYQSPSLAAPDSLAACAKHYVGYGAAEAGRDYNSTWIPEGLLRDVYLKPFEAATKAGVATLMSAFNAINGVPASANPFTLRQVLRNEWRFDGFVVSDYMSVHELIAHGVAVDGADAARKAIDAGVDMEMVSDDYLKHGAQLLAEKKLDIRMIDEAVRCILRIKFRMGLFDGRHQSVPDHDLLPTEEVKSIGRKLAGDSHVLLKNDDNALPLTSSVKTVAVIGSLANSPSDQLGTWANADAKHSITPLASLESRMGKENVFYASGQVPEEGQKDNVENRILSKSHHGFLEALAAAQKADVVLVFLGESSGLSGEASCRSDINLPGSQAELVSELVKSGKPLIGIIMAGRPLIFHETAAKLSAVLYVWQGGTMAGPAIVDTLFGDIVPSGKLPVTFPQSVGQVPLYYDHLNTGRPPALTGPASEDRFRSKYLDVTFTPEYPFGFGLSYSKFTYSNGSMTSPVLHNLGTVAFSADITNAGKFAASEIVQFYTHQIAATVARPVRELKDFQKIHLEPGETKNVIFQLEASELGFHNSHMKLVTEPGHFEAWIAPDSASGIKFNFELAKA